MASMRSRCSDARTHARTSRPEPSIRDVSRISGDTVHGSYPAAHAHLDSLTRLGIDYSQVTDSLEREGLTKFENSWNELGATVSHELHAAS
jgi:transaldolase